MTMPWSLPQQGHFLVGLTADQSVVVCVGDASSSWTAVQDRARAAGVAVDTFQWVAYTQREPALAKATRLLRGREAAMTVVHVSGGGAT